MSRDRRLTIFAALAILPLLFGAIALPVVTGLPDVCLQIDMALLELYVRNAMEGNQMVGPYSRFGWNHPGPIYFYMLSPIYVLSGERSSSLMWGALLINLICLIALSALLVKKTATRDPHFAFVSTGLLVFFLFFFGPDRLASPWNPWAIVLPFMLFIHLCVMLSAGEILYLPFVAIVGSFLAQTHLGTAPTVLVLTLVSCVISAPARTPSLRSRRNWLSIASTLAVTLLIWSLPLIEELRSHPGNLSGILGFFARSNYVSSWADAVHAVAEQLSWFPLGLLRRLELEIPEFEFGSLSIAFASAQVIGLVCILVKARARGNAFRLRLCLACLTAVFAATWSASRIQGHIFGYLVSWISPIGFINWSILITKSGEYLAGLAPRFPTIAKAVKAAVLAALLIAAAANVSLFLKPSPPAESAKIKSLSKELIGYLRDNQVEKPIFLFNWSNWTVDSALILQLHKQHVPFAARSPWPGRRPNWPLLLAPRYQPSGNERDFIMVRGKAFGERPGYRAAAGYEDTWVYVKPSRGGDEQESLR